MDENLRTRVISLDLGQDRDPGQNLRTAWQPVGDSSAEMPFEALFVAHYPAIRELARCPEAGLGVVVVDRRSCRLTGRLWLRRNAEQPSVAVVGRHSKCDLVLEHPSISLRHVALLVPPGADGYTIQGLRSGLGLRDQIGSRIGAARVDGAGMFSVGGTVLFTFETGTSMRWREVATEAWRELSGGSNSTDHEPRPARASLRVGDLRSRITVIGAPVGTDTCLLEGEPRRGVLGVSSAAGEVRIALGHSALRRGVLLGRYPRCDAARALVDDRISRVHLLVQQVGERVYAFDTASTGGVYAGSDQLDERRVVDLSDGETARLADEGASVRLLGAEGMPRLAR